MRLLLVWGLLAFWAQACMPLTDRVTLWLNKPGVRLSANASERLGAWREKFPNLEVHLEKDPSGVSRIFLRSRSVERPVAIRSSVDLRPWFEERSCLLNWDLFHECLSERRNPRDEKLYRKLDRQFVSKVICEEGHRCIDPTFPRWSLHWSAPALITIEAEIGKGGFATLDAAKESLHRINALLKKVLYGARFPERKGEGRSMAERFEIQKVRSRSDDFAKPLKVLLERLSGSGALTGLSDSEIERIAALARGGATIYYRAKGCPDEGNPEDRHLVEVREENKTVFRQIETDAPTGWRSLRAMASVSFDEKRCPHFSIMK